MGELRRREEGGRLRNPRGCLSLGREVGETPGLGHWCSAVLVPGDGVKEEIPCR